MKRKIVRAFQNKTLAKKAFGYLKFHLFERPKKYFPSIWRAVKFYFFCKLHKIDYYNIRDARSFFAKRKSNHPVSKENLLRIANAYNLSKNHQLNIPNVYKVGGQWERILRVAHEDLSSALTRLDIDKVGLILSQFGVDKVSLGLSLSGNMPNNYLDSIHMVNEYNLARNLWEENSNLPEEVLEYPLNIGRFPGIIREGKLIVLAAFRLSYFASKVYNLLIKHDKNEFVLEIGGGYGGLAFHLFRDMKFSGNYINLDIPEISVLCTYFLMSVFPDKKILLYGEETNLTRDVLEKYEIVILPNFALPNLPADLVDVSFNSHSMTEMNYDTVDEYMLQLGRIVKKYFLHANHENEVVYTSSSGKIKQSGNLNESRQPNNFITLYRIPELITNTGNEFDGYFEYLLQKKDL